MSASTNDGDSRSRAVRQRVPSGPQRTRSIRAYLRQTRLIAFGAIAVLAGGIVAGLTNEGFWERHALLSSIVASVLVVLVSVALINEVIEQRRRKRWRVLAQYVMF